MKLTSKQRSFVDHYVTCRNGAESARRAGYGIQSARVTASRLLTKANIKAALAVKEMELNKIVQIDKKRVVNELIRGIELARLQANAGTVISGWMRVAGILGLDKPESGESYVHNADLDVLSEKLKGMSLEELQMVAQGDFRVQADLRFTHGFTHGSLKKTKGL
jgi:hypothetical protein